MSDEAVQGEVPSSVQCFPGVRGDLQWPLEVSHWYGFIYFSTENVMHVRGGRDEKTHEAYMFCCVIL